MFFEGICPRMNCICMVHCNLGKNPEILSIVLQSEVKYIDLGHNIIDSLGATKSREQRTTHPQNIWALAITTSMMKMHLSFLRRWSGTSGVFDNSSLNAITQSNHKCVIHVANCQFYSHNNFTTINNIIFSITSKTILLPSNAAWINFHQNSC